MKCIVMGLSVMLFSVTLLLTMFLPEQAIIFAQCIVMIALGIFLLKK